MKSIKRIPVTKEGFEKLKKELEDLKTDRPNAVRTLADARGMGDLSENGLYTAAKSRLRSIDNQIFRLEVQIKLADIADQDNNGIIGIGRSVTLENDGNQAIFHIVGDYEANPAERKISQHSPLGKVLMHKKKGDVVEFSAPKGMIRYAVVEVK